MTNNLRRLLKICWHIMLQNVVYRPGLLSDERFTVKGQFNNNTATIDYNMRHRYVKYI